MEPPQANSSNADRQPLIELVPTTAAKDLPPGGKFEERWVTTEQQIEAGVVQIPVPAEPLHLCPTCDYNLTGITARRCPECGEPFTMADARDRGVEKAIGYRRYFVSAQYEQWKFRIGWMLIAAGFLMPVFFGSSPRPAWGLRGGAMIYLTPIFLAFACFYKVIRDTTWADAILVAGLGAALLGAAIAFL